MSIYFVCGAYRRPKRGKSVPLDDREQQILQEIERRLYEEDPQLANTVGGRRGVRLPIAGIVLGLAILTLFTVTPLLGALGFVLIVVSTTSLLRSLSLRGVGKSLFGEDSFGKPETPPDGKRRD